MREALDVGEPGFKLRQDFEYAVGVVFRAESFGNFAGVLVRTADESDGTRSKHGLRLQFYIHGKCAGMRQSCHRFRLFIPTTAIILPVTPFSPRWEKNKSWWQRVHCARSEMFFAGIPAASNWRRLASARSRKIFFGNSLCPGAREVRNNSGYFS